MDCVNLLQNSCVQNIFAQLGTIVNDTYVPTDHCIVILMYIDEKLSTPNQNSRNFRQIIGLSQLIKKDLLPLLMATNNKQILEILMKILANLMLPVESLVPIRQLINDEITCSIIFSLKWTLATNKTACIDIKIIKRILKIIKDSKNLSKAQKEGSSHINVTIFESLRFIKHILQGLDEEYQNNLIWMLFSERFGEILIDLIDHSNRKQWVVLIIELIALIFKNQHVDHISKLLSNTIINESSEDNESNTSLYPRNETPSFQESSSGSSNSEDNNNKKLKETLVKDKECTVNLKNIQEKQSINEDDNNKTVSTENRKNKKEEYKSKNEFVEKLFENKIHSKITADDPISKRKIKFRLKKYTKKIKKTKLDLLTSPTQSPSELYVPRFLQRFIFRFLPSAFNTLIDELYNLLTTATQKNADVSLIFWILIYFSRFCKLKGIELKSFKRIISFKLISFIVHEGLQISEKFMIAKRQQSRDIHLIARHLHLAIMAIKEVIKNIEFHIITDVTSTVHEELISYLKNSSTLSEFIICIEELKSMIVWFIRHYDSKFQAIEYLKDLIVTNHILLIFIDNLKDWLTLDNTTHIKKFANHDIMFKYGTILQKYQENDNLVNDSILTIMHHIVREVENTTALFQPIIYAIFLNLFAKKDDLYRRWPDLIEYVIGTNGNSPETKTILLETNLKS